MKGTVDKPKSVGQKGVEKQLFDEIVKREKEVGKLRDAYEVLSGSKFVGIGTISIGLTMTSKGAKTKKGTTEFSERVSEAMTEYWKRKKAKGAKRVKGAKGAKVPYERKYKTREERSKAQSKRMKRYWKKRKAMGKVSKVAKVVKGYEKKYDTQEERSKAQSKKMKGFWAKWRRKKLGKEYTSLAEQRKEELERRGLPTEIETPRRPVEPLAPVDMPKPIEQKGIMEKKETGRLSFLPVGRVRKNRIWTEEEDEVLKALWKEHTPAEIAKRLLRTVKNIEKRYVKLKEDAVVGRIMKKPKSEQGAKFMKSYRKSWDNGLIKTKQRWSPAEDKLLKELAGRDWRTSRQISKELKRSVGSIVMRYLRVTGENVLPADRKRGKRGNVRTKIAKRGISKLNLFRGG